ncbi:hypothetical protein CTM53_00065 [Prevotella intermedia]|uniref:Uncharacterized protein n=1 Tax=Prevotella intermedia TaxID=28131 RepID=A0A2G9IF96_PREIN|nr:hypothetical protein CUC04_01765 [Prevotella intermedia]PJI19357.1 hypothetical protein CTM53_00065 [Prevotella intermedia]PJI27311.1 hypothetical protein CTM58_03910 [Prevotella intermedia]
MHGKSGSFATQNLRFRNVKTQLALFKEIIFTKLMLFPAFSKPFLCTSSCLAAGYNLPHSSSALCNFLGVRNVINHAPTHRDLWSVTSKE